jgi:hypothetical protein
MEESHMSRTICLAIFVSVLLLQSCNNPSGQENQGGPAHVEIPIDAGSKNLNASRKELTPEFKSVVERFQKLLATKRSDPLFYAQYEYALGAPSLVAISKSVKKFIQSGDFYYTEEKSDLFQSTILIKGRNFYWKYFDTSYGDYYFAGPVDLQSTSPEDFLSSGGFLHNTYGEFDQNLVQVVEGILEKATVEENASKSDVTNLVISSRVHGKLRLTSDSSSFSITRLEPPDGVPSTLLQFKYSKDLTKEFRDPAEQILATFEKPAPSIKINLLKGPITWDAIFDEYFAQLTQVRDVAKKEAMEIARKFGYLYPTKNPEIVKSAQTYFGQLSLSVEVSGRIYMFHQFPPANIDFSPLERFTKRKRNAKGFEVLEVIIDHLNWRQVYYVNRENKQALIFDDPVDFEDKKLDSLVESFTVIPKRK